METGNPTLNQKVFITLTAYSKVMDFYRRICESEKANESGSLTQRMNAARKDTLEQIFMMCDLPWTKIR